MSSQYCLFYEKYALDFADQYLKWLQITYILFVNTENRMSLRVQGIAQWESCAASFFSIPANILLLGKSLNCLYLSQFLTDFHFLKKQLNASVLPQFWSTHLTSSFNFKFFKTGRANSHCAMHCNGTVSISFFIFRLQLARQAENKVKEMAYFEHYYVQVIYDLTFI